MARRRSMRLAMTWPRQPAAVAGKLHAINLMLLQVGPANVHFFDIATQSAAECQLRVISGSADNVDGLRRTRPVYLS
jgi:hypothetical protein